MTAQQLADEAMEAMEGVLLDASIARETYAEALEILIADLEAKRDAAHDEIEMARREAEMEAERDIEVED